MSRLAKSLATVALALSISGAARASDLADGWLSTTHVGFGFDDRSSTGFDDVAGSLLFMDVARSVGPLLGQDIEVGLRTVAQGAKRSDSEFYRLGAGPFASLHLSVAWSVQAAVQVFKETGLGDDGQAAYHSRGQALMLGWERSFQLARRVELGWGGFLSWHRGDFDTVASMAPQTSRRYEGVGHNVGLSRGVELALRLAL